MITITAKTARATFSEVLSRTAYTKECTIVTRNGKQLAALVPIEDLALLEKVREAIEYRRDTAEARLALEEVETEGTISWEDAQTELGL